MPFSNKFSIERSLDPISTENFASLKCKIRHIDLIHSITTIRPEIGYNIKTNYFLTTDTMHINVFYFYLLRRILVYRSYYFWCCD